MTTTFIYALCEPGTRTIRYIGKTNNLKNRARQHRCNSVRHATHLGCWLRSLAGVPPEMITLREVPGDGVDAEMRYIRLARGCRMELVNATDGGEGVTQTPEIKAKIGAALKGKPFTPSHLAAVQAAGQRRLGIAPPNKGKPMSENQKEFLRGLVGEAHPQFGRKRSDEAKVRMSVAQKGHFVSEAAKAHMSAAHQGPKYSGVNHSQFGVPRSEESKAKMRAAVRPKASEETKAKMSESARLAWAARKQKGGVS